MRMMDLDDLHVFRAIVREGGINRAAHHLHRVPSGVTTRIKQFEERLGTPLFRRQGRALVLTDAGQVLLGHAERILQLADRAEQELRGGGVRGVLRLGSLESAAGARLPPLLAAFHARHPDVSLELQTGTTASLLRRLERFEIEAAFVSEPFETGRLSARWAFREELVLISAQGGRALRHAADLAGATLVAFPQGCSYRRRLMEWLATDGVSPSRVLDLGSYHAIVACVAAGAGVAVIPAEILETAVLGGSVQRHALPEEIRISRTHLVWSGPPSAPLLAMMELLSGAPAEP